jgi:hypothetical protein
MKIDPKKTFKLLLAIIILLGILFLVSREYIINQNFPPESEKLYLLQKFNLDGELTLPAWFSSLLLASSSALCFINSSVKKRHKNDPKDHRYWAGLGVVFLYLSLDEMIALHEIAVNPVQEAFGITSGLLYFAWIIPAVVLLSIVCLIYLKFFLRLPMRTRKFLVLSGLVFVGGAVIVEAFSANFYSNTSTDLNSAYFTFSFLFEESMEMIGTSIFIYALLDHLKYTSPKEGINIQINK